MGNAADYYFRVKVDLDTEYPSLDAINRWVDLVDEMKTWCYINFSDEWGYDKYGFWFKTEQDKLLFTLKWLCK